jgi:hypothetical protein
MFFLTDVAVNRAKPLLFLVALLVPSVASAARAQGDIRPAARHPWLRRPRHAPRQAGPRCDLWSEWWKGARYLVPSMLPRARGFAWRLRRVGTVGSLSGHGTALRNFFGPRLPGGGPDRRSFRRRAVVGARLSRRSFGSGVRRDGHFLFQRDACGSDPQLRQGTDRLGRASLVVLPAQTTLPTRPVIRSRPRRSSRANSTSRRSLRARQGPPMHERRAGI